MKAIEDLYQTELTKLPIDVQALRAQAQNGPFNTLIEGI